jgi:chloride channel 2
MLATAVACGVATSVSSVIGGVLFSIEVTSTYYPIRNYWYAFTAALIGGITFKVLFNLFFGYRMSQSINNNNTIRNK